MRKARYIAFTVIACGFVLTVMFVGRGETVEFSPDRFEFRSRDVWYLVPFRIPLYSRVVDTWPHPLQDLWADLGITPETTSNPRWDVVRYWTPGNAAEQTILHDLTCAKVVNFGDHWRDWTAAYPRQAVPFWHEVTDLIRQQQYHDAIAVMQKHASDDLSVKLD